ncbi:hypothetical protein ACJIZ3_004813 [Penstemon smallii]|uniref:Uncharacterized protein n=1 Tax=Penstemon smallii TaxID=265156 RepID=A0ABD3S3D4_9LAMI
MAEPKNSCEGLRKSRKILGDVTNRLGKRGISEGEKNGIKSLDFKRPRPCTGINSLKGNVISGISLENRVTNASDFGGGSIDVQNDRDAVNSVETEAGDLLKENAILGIAETKSPDLKHAVDLTINGGKSQQLVNSETNEELSDSFHADSSWTVSETSGDYLDDGKNFNANEANISTKYNLNDINDYPNGTEDHIADNLVLSQSGSIDCTILQSQESRVFGTERSAESRKGDECADMCVGIDSIKACSCSFCTKAAYIWLDLNHQDIKARVSVMRKSQKEAMILAERSSRNKAIEKHGGESSRRVSSLESNLRYQWRSLFQNMAGIWEEEGNQLEASLLPLSDLREKCKTDLELINSTPLEKH